MNRNPSPFFIDLTGNVFGGWTVLHSLGRRNGKHHVWWCRCRCGLEKSVFGDHLRLGKSKACKRCAGIVCAPNLKHGMARSHSETKEWRSWFSAKQRCFNPNDAEFKNVGGRGITMCVGWKTDSKSFLSDMGACPKGKTLDRKNVNGHYSCGHCEECKRMGWPSNCRWADTFEQGNNRRNNRVFEVNGILKTLTEWGRHFGVPPPLISVRLNRLKWTVEEAICIPPYKPKPRNISDVYEMRQLRILVWARDCGMCARCGLKKSQWEVHHKVPKFEGGTSELVNLETLCIDCHLEETNTKRAYWAKLRRRKRLEEARRILGLSNSQSFREPLEIAPSSRR